MNIDYEAIAEAAANKTGCIVLTASYVKDIIEAYEAQKQQPEWVPLDLEKVKQGWEVRQARWQEDADPHRFVATYEGDMVVEVNGGVHRRVVNGFSWLMRAPKPKTVHVRVFKSKEDEHYASFADPKINPISVLEFVGEGDIEVSK